MDQAQLEGSDNGMQPAHYAMSGCTQGKEAIEAQFEYMVHQEFQTEEVNAPAGKFPRHNVGFMLILYNCSAKH